MDRQAHPRIATSPVPVTLGVWIARDTPRSPRCSHSHSHTHSVDCQAHPRFATSHSHGHNRRSPGTTASHSHGHNHRSPGTTADRHVAVTVTGTTADHHVAGTTADRRLVWIARHNRGSPRRQSPVTLAGWIARHIRGSPRSQSQSQSHSQCGSPVTTAFCRAMQHSKLPKVPDTSADRHVAVTVTGTTLTADRHVASHSHSHSRSGNRQSQPRSVVPCPAAVTAFALCRATHRRCHRLRALSCHTPPCSLCRVIFIVMFQSYKLTALVAALSVCARHLRSSSLSWPALDRARSHRFLCRQAQPPIATSQSQSRAQPRFVTSQVQPPIVTSLVWIARHNRGSTRHQSPVTLAVWITRNIRGSPRSQSQSQSHSQCGSPVTTAFCRVMQHSKHPAPRSKSPSNRVFSLRTHPFPRANRGVT